MKLAVIGHNIQYSLSPKIHHYWISHYGLPGSYEIIDQHPVDFAAHLAHYEGGNITTPYKEKIIPHLHQLTPVAQAIGAVNTFFESKGKLIGDNTDYLAIKEVLQDFPNRRKAMILGRGGAAKAALFALKELKVAAFMCSRLPRQEPEVSWQDRHHYLQEVNILINATPLGLNNQGCPVEFLPSHPCLVIDMVYQPVQTPLINLAKQGGHFICDGLEILIRQARHSFKCWWNIMPTLDGIREHLK